MTNTNADYACPNLANGECREPCHPDYCAEQSAADDLLTEDERQALTEDLARIHKTMYPCWARQIDRSEES
jgi:hypothetical protein